MEEKILNKLKDIELEILNEIDRICTENNLQYFLVGGTLLGAIRHKGFIPWDDDLDIGMFRKDYNRFLKLCSSQLGGKFFLHTHITDGRYWLPFAKIRKNGTIYQEYFQVSCSTKHEGVWIDIFPLDNATKQSSKIQQFQFKLVGVLRSIITQKCNIEIENFYKNDHKIRMFLLKPFSARVLSRLLQKIMSWNRNHNSKYVVNLGSQYGIRKQTIPRDKYFPAIRLDFEGKEFYAPNDWDYILTSIYGDYMELPAKEKRITHNPVRIKL